MSRDAVQAVVDRFADELGRSVVVNDPEVRMLFASRHFGDEDPVVMTEKDAVKCKRFAKANHWVLPVSASLDPAFQRWLLEKLSGSKAA